MEFALRSAIVKGLNMAAKNYPYRYHDIIADMKKLRFAFGHWNAEDPLGSAKTSAALGGVSFLPYAKLLFMPDDLSTKVWEASPSLVKSDMVRVPHENIFVEFGRPIHFTNGGGAAELVYGFHILQAELNSDITPEKSADIYRRAPELWRRMWAKDGISSADQLYDASRETYKKAGRTIAITYWYRSVPDDGVWTCRTVIFPTKTVTTIERNAYVDPSGKRTKVDTQETLNFLSFPLFLTSSNISYETQEPPAPERKDRYWWKPQYAQPFEMVVIKDIPKRIRLSLKRGEAGTERHWESGRLIKGHFKVLSYCGACQRRTAILRFIRKELCPGCSTILNPESAVTRTFWWDEHWAGPDIVDNVIGKDQVQCK